MNNTNQPTILVKKSDGTSARMTMDELQAYKKAQTISAPAPVSVPVAPQKSIQPIEQNMQSKQEEKPISKVPEKKFVRPVPPKEEKMFTENWEEDDHKSLLDDSLPKENLPAIKTTTVYMPATSTPVKNIFVDEAKYSERQNKQSMQSKQIKPAFDKSVQSKPASVQAKPAVPFIIPSKSAPQPISYKLEAKSYNEKLVIQDIKPPKIEKQSVGPVDELAIFSLTDFRRLELNSKFAGIKLLEKFKTLEQDSYLLFMEGVKAWYNSPIYKQYQDILYQSLTRGKSVNEILASGNYQKDLKPEEFKAVLSVNESIN